MDKKPPPPNGPGDDRLDNHAFEPHLSHPFATVTTFLETVSGEIVLEKLIDTLMRTAIEHTGADRGLFILPRGGAYAIEAEATTGDNGVTVELRHTAVKFADLPQSVLRHALRTKEPVLIQDGAAENAFSADEYIRRHRAHSVLCLPLLKQPRVLGVLYLENTLAPYVFTPARIATLKLLASATAVCLENMRICGDLHDREARIRRLVDSNIIGIGIWTLDGRILDANDAFLSILGHTRSDLANGGMSWMELTAPEWRAPSARAMEDAKATGVFQPFEKEYQRKDGSRVPALVGGALFDPDGNEGVAFVLDLSKEQQAARAQSRSEAFLARIRSLEVLTATVAHEISQPLTGIIINATTCLRMLDKEPPNFEAARVTAQRTLRDGDRASNVIRRWRDLLARQPHETVAIDLNDVARRAVALTSNELKADGVTVEIPVAAQERRGI